MEDFGEAAKYLRLCGKFAVYAPFDFLLVHILII